MNYSPKQLYVWDTWCMPVGEVMHLYHLQRRRPGTEVPDAVHDALGHAVSTNLVDWAERPTAFGPDTANPHDDEQPWTGCALWHEGQGYLYYTMRGSSNARCIQHIGLATTRDPDCWERFAGNPVITPDPRWYATPARPVPGIVDCRDLIVVRDPAGEGWYGYYATRQPGEELPETSVIACAYSTDLLHWEQRPPVFAPDRYACLEVPDVFELNGRWYLTCLTGHWYGNRGYWPDPYLVAGTMFAVADSPAGPFEELPGEHVLLAGRGTAPFSCRSVAFQGERYLLYTDHERSDHTDTGDLTFGTISTPKVLRTDGDRLYAAYSPRIESHVTAELVTPGVLPQRDEAKIWGQIWQMPTARWTWGPTISGESRTGWGMAVIDAAPESFIYEATITLEEGAAAGLGVRLDEQMSGAAVVLDAQQQALYFAEAPSFDYQEKRLTPIPHGQPLHLRVVSRLEHVEIYLTDELRLAFVRYKGIGGKVGLFVDRGRARFEQVRLRALAVTRGE